MWSEQWASYQPACYETRSILICLKPKSGKVAQSRGFRGRLERAFPRYNVQIIKILDNFIVGLSLNSSTIWNSQMAFPRVFGFSFRIRLSKRVMAWQLRLEIGLITFRVVFISIIQSVCVIQWTVFFCLGLSVILAFFGIHRRKEGDWGVFKSGTAYFPDFLLSRRCCWRLARNSARTRFLWARFSWRSFIRSKRLCVRLMFAELPMLMLSKVVTRNDDFQMNEICSDLMGNCRNMHVFI